MNVIRSARDKVTKGDVSYYMCDRKAGYSRGVELQR